MDASTSPAAAAFSYIQQQSTRIFHHIFDSSQEENCLSPINQPMVVCECNVHHWSWNYVASNNHWAAHYWVHPQDSRLPFQPKDKPINYKMTYVHIHRNNQQIKSHRSTNLRRIDDGSTQKTSIDTTIGYGKRSPSHLINWYSAIIGLLSKIIDLLLNLRKIHIFCIAENWNNKTLMTMYILLSVCDMRKSYKYPNGYQNVHKKETQVGS